MAKVSGLEARLEALAAEVQTVSEDVALLKTQLGDADIPADAEATLERLETNMANLVTSVTPAAPQPAPVPPPAAPTA
jgi:archaellum component FlaC